MKLNAEQLGNLWQKVSITVENDDYLSTFNQEIKKKQDKAHLKGFRKGRTPLSYVKKIYGDNTLAETVNQKAFEALNDYIKKEDIKIIGEPMLSEDQQPLKISYKSNDDYEIIFEIGMQPASIDIKGIAESDTYEKLVTDIPDSEIDFVFQEEAKRFGTMKEVNESPIEKDLITFNADIMLEDPEGNNEPSEIEILVMFDDIDEEYKKQLSSLKPDDSIDLDMLKIEGKDQTYVDRYYVKLKEGETYTYNNNIKAYITKIQRREPLEIGEELFGKLFPEEEDKSKENTTAKIREILSTNYDQSAENKLKVDIRDNMVKETKIELPDDFLKSWLKRTKKEEDKEMTDEEFDSFKEGLALSLMVGKISSENKIEVQYPELEALFASRVKSYMGAYGNNEMIPLMVQNLMKDEQQVRMAHDQIMTNKVLDHVRSLVTIKENKLDFKAFKEKLN